MKKIPARRYTKSHETYWKDLFNDFSKFNEDSAISGWSNQGLEQRVNAYMKVLPRFSLKKESLILDLGCGAGVYSRLLAKNGYHVIAVDYAWKVVKKALHRNSSGRIKFLSANANSLPFRDNFFNHVVCIGLLQSLTDCVQTIKEIFRVLQIGGSLCLTTLNRREIKTTIQRMLGIEDFIVVNGKHRPRLMTYNPSTLLDIMEGIGYESVRAEPLQIVPNFFSCASPLLPVWNKIPVIRYLTARSFMVTGLKNKF